MELSVGLIDVKNKKSSEATMTSLMICFYKFKSIFDCNTMRIKQKNLL